MPRNPKNELEKKGIFYSLQTSIESMIDLVAMSIKDLGIPVEDDTTNISNFIKKRDLSKNLGINLQKANGLRNLLVHRYNNVDDEIIMNSVTEIKNLLFSWLDEIEKLLNEFKND
ncbi:MAG: DUF86 domain-containing protein [Candidatus Lokiarchaeota archaeon]